MDIPQHHLEARRPAPISFDAARAEAASQGIAESPHASHNGGEVLRDASVSAVRSGDSSLHDGVSVGDSTSVGHPQIDDCTAFDIGGRNVSQRTDAPAQMESAE